jgi:hypothetical protein
MGAGRPDTPGRPSIAWTNRADNSGKAVTISWGPVGPNGPGPTTYTVHRTGGGAPKDVCTWVQATSCQDDLANNGEVYSYTVQAKNAEADSPDERQAGGGALHVSSTSPAATIEAAAQPATVNITDFHATGSNGQAQVSFDVGPSHGKENTVRCTVNGSSCGSWSYPVGGQGGQTKTISGLPNGADSTVHLVACNGSSGGTGAGDACSADSSRTTVTYGPIGSVSLTAAKASDTSTSWHLSVDPNGKPAHVVVTLDGSTISSFDTGRGAGTWSGTNGVGRDHTSKYHVAVTDTANAPGQASARAGKTDSAQATTPPPPPTIDLSKGGKVQSSTCWDASCAYLKLKLANFSGSQQCIPHSDASGGPPFSQKTLGPNYQGEPGWYFGYPGKHIYVQCGSVKSNTLTW